MAPLAKRIDHGVGQVDRELEGFGQRGDARSA